MWVPKNRCFIVEDPVKILSTWTIYHQHCEGQAVRDSLSLSFSLSLSEKIWINQRTLCQEQLLVGFNPIEKELVNLDRSPSFVG